MLTTDVVNQLLCIKESYQAPQKMLKAMLDEEKRTALMNEFLEYEYRLGYEWFHEYFQNEHSDKKVKKQDFTPNSVSELLAGIGGESKVYFESAAGTGGIFIQHWNERRMNTNPLLYDPRAFWYQLEELSDRAIPFLIFNMAIRGVNGVILHGDSLDRTFKDVYFIRNDSADFMRYSDVIHMPRTDVLMQELNIMHWEEEGQ